MTVSAPLYRRLMGNSWCQPPESSKSRKTADDRGSLASGDPGDHRRVRHALLSRMASAAARARGPMCRWTEAPCGRDFLYAVLFATLPWIAWHGRWVLVLIAVLIAEIVLPPPYRDL